MKELDEIAAVQRQADMTKVAAQISTQFGVSMAEVSESLKKFGEKMSTSSPMARLPREDLSNLQRVAYMAGRLLPAMREAGISHTHFAEFTALRDALLVVQNSETGIKPMGDEELLRDLLDLASDLEPPK